MDNYEYSYEKLLSAAETLIKYGEPLDKMGLRLANDYLAACRPKAELEGLSETDSTVLWGLFELIRDYDGNTTIEEKDARKLEADIYRITVETGKDVSLDIKSNYIAYVSSYAAEATVVAEESFDENAQVYNYLTAVFKLYEKMPPEEKQDLTVRVNIADACNKMGILYANFEPLKTLDYYKRGLEIFKTCKYEYNEYSDDDYDKILSDKYDLVDFIYSSIIEDDDDELEIGVKKALTAERIKLLEEWLPVKENLTGPADEDMQKIIIPRYELIGEYYREKEPLKSFNSFGKAYYKRHTVFDYENNKDDDEDTAINLYKAASDILEAARLSADLGLGKNEQLKFWRAAHSDLIRVIRTYREDYVMAALAESYLGLGLLTDKNAEKIALQMGTLIADYVTHFNSYSAYGNIRSRVNKRIGEKRKDFFADISAEYIKNLTQHINAWADALMAEGKYDFALNAYEKLIEGCENILSRRKDTEAELYLYYAICMYLNIEGIPVAEIYITQQQHEKAKELDSKADRLYLTLKQSFSDDELEARLNNIKDNC